jgi:hypothetical protein
MLKYNVKRTAPSKDSFISYLQHITPCPHTLATLMPSLTSKPLLLLLVRRNSHSIAQEQRRGQGERERRQHPGRKKIGRDCRQRRRKLIRRKFVSIPFSKENLNPSNAPK